MDQKRALVIPEDWTKEIASLKTTKQDNDYCFVSIPTANLGIPSKARLTTVLKQTLRSSGLLSAVVVLPTDFAKPVNVKYWPKMIISSKNEAIVTSVIFADNWLACKGIIDTWQHVDNPFASKHHLTCQYQPPYTDMLERWRAWGARSLHPGDYFKTEILVELSQMQGHWVYWGHSDNAKIHGYQYISSKELLQHRPAIPLQSTLWFSCSTLGSRTNNSIALDWFLNGATLCLLASTQPVKTTDNQLLSAAWLEVCQHSTAVNVADIIQQLLRQDSQTFTPILDNYRLMGSPWIKFA